MTVNGFVSMQNIGMFADRGVSDARAQAMQAGPDGEQETRYYPRQEIALAPVPEQDSFPVVPPPPLYSEPESSPVTQLKTNKIPTVSSESLPNSGFTDILPPVLEVQTVQTSPESEEKDHDSGFDQGPESLTITPSVNQADDVPLERREDPDSGSSLDVVSTIPPPADFDTRPLTPPCQFANATVAPPEEFINSEEGKKEQGQSEEAKPRKKLNISDGLFPWMNEPQAPLNAAIPLEVSKDKESDWVVVNVNAEETTPVTENSTEQSVSKGATETTTQQDASTVVVPSATTAVYSKPAPLEVKTRSAADKPVRQEMVNNLDIVSTTPEVNGRVVVGKDATVVEKPTAGLQRIVSTDKSQDPGTLQTAEIKELKEIVTNEVMVTNMNSKLEEQSGSKQALNTIVKPVKPETTAEPVSFVKEKEIQVEAEVDIQQYSLPSTAPLTEDLKQEPPVKPTKPDLQIKPEKQSLQVKPVKPDLQVKPVMPDPQVKPEKPVVEGKPETVIRETEVKVAPTAFDQPTEPVRLESPVEAGKLERVKPEKPQIKGKPVTLVKEAEVTVDVQKHTPAEAGKQETQLEPKKPEQQVKSEKPEVIAKPVLSVKDAEVKVTKPEPVVVKVDSQVKPDKMESKVTPTAFVKEAEVKVDTRQVGHSSFNPSAEASRPQAKVETVEPDKQVEPVEPYKPVETVVSEKVKSSPVEEVVIPHSKPEVEMCFASFKEEQRDHPDGLPQGMRDKAVGADGYAAPVQETPVKIVSVGEKDIVAEAPVTPETKLVSSGDDKLKDLEAKLQKLDEEPVPSSSNSKKLESKAVPAPVSPHREVTPSIQTKDPFSEDIIVAETKQVESSNYEHYEALFKIETEEESKSEVTCMQLKHKPVVVTERQQSLPESSTTRVDLKSELSLDLSSLRRSPEPPRPPSSSPPAASPRASTLPSPSALNSDRSTDSGFSPSEEFKGPSSPDKKTFGSNSLSNSDTIAVEAQTVNTSDKSSEEREPKRLQSSSAAQTDIQDDTNSVQTSKPQNITKRPMNVSSKLQRPLSMPAGIVSVNIKSETVQDKSKSSQSDSRKSSSSDATDVSSPSPASSPVDSSKTEPVDLPKPPPFTVPPLRRYSDLAADLSFISSAAKAAEKANESESKADAPPKTPNPLLRRNPGTAVERPRSWVGPETDTKKKPVMWTSAFKPVSFDAEAKKGVRPVEFQVKSFTTPSVVPKESTAPSTTYVNSAASVHSAAPVKERVGANIEVEKTSKQAPFVPVKPSTVKPTAAVVSSLPRDGESSTRQPVKRDSKLERAVSNPETEKTGPGDTKYEIIYSNKSSTSQGSSKDHNDPTDEGSRTDLPHPGTLRDQIMRDQAGGHSRVTRNRPHSTILSGAKFQIIPADEKSPSGTHGTDAKKPTTVQPKTVSKSEGVSWTQAKQHTNEQSKPVLPPPTTVKPQPSAKSAAAGTKPLPAVVMRAKTGGYDPTKRHSLPSYIIEGADAKPPTIRTSGSGEAKVLNYTHCCIGYYFIGYYNLIRDRSCVIWLFVKMYHG